MPAAFERVGGSPFGVAVAPRGRWSFVSLISGAVAVYRDGRNPLPRLVRVVRLPGRAAALGDSVSSDGRYLLVADGNAGAVVLDAAQVATGHGKPIVATLASRGGGAIEVELSRDNRYAFVSVEGGAELAVYNLAAAVAGRTGRAVFVGDIPVGLAPVGMAASPDGRWLYATSQIARSGTTRQVGTLSVISVAKAEKDPAHSVMATVPAGCNPVRVITSADGSVIWVTARASDALLAFSARLLRSHPAKALIADVRVGELPVGLALLDGGRRIVVADSNRLGIRGKTASLAVVDVRAALTGHRALIGYLPAAGFPRQMALEPGGRVLLVTNFSSGQLEAVTVASLP